MGHYQFLDSVAIADCALEIEADSLDDLFETAARALADVMVDADTMPLTVERTVTLEAESLDLLLWDWLAELIFLKDSEQLIFPRASVDVSTGVPCSLAARLTGGPIDPERVALRADAKAVTFHQFALEPRGDRWWARVVIDI